MSTDVFVALIALVGTVIASVAGAYAVTARGAAEQKKEAAAHRHKIDKQLTEVSVKVHTLWTIYAEDAIRSARTSGMIASRSEERPTDKWNSAVSNELNSRIQGSIIEVSKILRSPYDVSIEVWMIYSDELLKIAEKEDIMPSALFGTVLSMSATGVTNA